jgi:putative transposase
MTFEVSFVVEKEYKHKKKTKKSVGLDVGLKSMITGTTSDGKVIQVHAEKHLKKKRKKLKQAQQNLSRKQEHAVKEKRSLNESKNYQKQRVKVAKIHSLIMRTRKDYIEKLTYYLVCLFDCLVLEDISIKDLVADKTKDIKSRKAKRNINRTYADISLGLFLSKLKQKASMYGKSIVIAEKNYKSTMLCNNCGSQNRENLKIQKRKWVCDVCGVSHDRDINASINLLKLAVGQTESINVCGESIRPVDVNDISGLFSMKQKTSLT